MNKDPNSQNNEFFSDDPKLLEILKRVEKNRTDSDKPAQNRPQLSEPIGNRPQPNRPVGSHPLPNRSSVGNSRPQPSRPMGSRPQPSRPMGNRPQPSRPMGSRPQPSRPMESRPQSERLMGNYPQPGRPMEGRPFPKGTNIEESQPFMERPQINESLIPPYQTDLADDKQKEKKSFFKKLFSKSEEDQSVEAGQANRDEQTAKENNEKDSYLQFDKYESLEDYPKTSFHEEVEPLLQSLREEPLESSNPEGEDTEALLKRLRTESHQEVYKERNDDRPTIESTEQLLRRLKKELSLDEHSQSSSFKEEEEKPALDNYDSYSLPEDYKAEKKTEFIDNLNLKATSQSSATEEDPDSLLTMEKSSNNFQTTAAIHVQDTKKKSSAAIVIGKLLFFLLDLILIGGIVLYLLIYSGNSLFGYHFYKVDDNAMEGMEKGALLITKPVNSSEFKTGDIISYVPENNARSVVISRVVDNPNGTLITRVDNNKQTLPAISTDLVTGKKLMDIPNLGKVYDFVYKNQYIVFAFVAVIASLLLILLFWRKKKPAAEHKSLT